MVDTKINISDNDNNKKCSITLCLLTLFHTVTVCLFCFVSCYGIGIFFSIPEDLLVDPLVDMIKRFMPLYLTNWNFDIIFGRYLVVRITKFPWSMDLTLGIACLVRSVTEIASRFINRAFQTIFLTMSLVYDAMEWTDKHETSIGKKLKYYRDILFSGAVVPVTMFVSTMFWTVYWIDRELVFPKVYDQIVPWWFNHCVHTNIAIVVLVETVLQERRHPTNLKIEFYLNAFIGVFYSTVYYSIYFFANRWLYGVFGIMNWWQVCLYQILIWSSMCMFYFVQFPINRIFHREHVKEQKNGTVEIQNGIGETSRIPEIDIKGDLKSTASRQLDISKL